MTDFAPWQTPTLCHTRMALITRREADVLAGICHGHSNAEIGRRLFITEDTVKTHVKRLYTAIGSTARTRAHVAALVCSGQVSVYVKGAAP